MSHPVPSPQAMNKDRVPLDRGQSWGREVSTSVVSKKMCQSLDVVMGWQDAVLPPRFAVGSERLRKLTLCVREQPVNFMIILHQSLQTAINGQSLCRLGSKASRVLLGQENADVEESDRSRFTMQTVEEIKHYASDLCEHTNGIQAKFRLLRSLVLDIHMDLNKIVDEKERSAFLARISRRLSNGFETCEDVLRKVHDDLEEIENSLDTITRWWQMVKSEAIYLQSNGESSLVVQKNRITLKEIGDGFATLQKYFAEYSEKMSQLYDENIGRLDDNKQKYIQGMRDCSDLVVSKGGRLEPRGS